MNQVDYSYFLQTHTKEKWEKIGTRRRAGVVVPLFSIYSKQSTGIGELPDINLLADWCEKTGMTIIQLLPLNDVGSDFAPYSSVSTFALDPMYLSPRNLVNIDCSKYEAQIIKIKNKVRPLFGRVNYKVKAFKLGLLWDIYKSTRTNNISEFLKFIDDSAYWLKDYAVYKVIKELHPDAGWENWAEKLKSRNPDALNEIELNNIERIQFHYWLQWQLYEQLKSAKQYAARRNVYIMGDLPFLVSRESADVWSHQNYFMLELSAGAPPDMYFAKGQQWGMPPYNWNNISNEGYKYVYEKLKYAENFYDMYRIDHFVGLFRIWVSPLDEELQKSVIGAYLPGEEYMWEQHGRKIIDVMTHSTAMLPCAEDLGTVPGCSYHVLYEYGIPGIDFQRYYKDNFRFKAPDQYRINSAAVISTHDSSFWVNWWQFEAGTTDEHLFELQCEKAGIDFRHYKYAKSVLFDKRLSKHGRLYWNDNIKTSDIMLDILNPPLDKANDFVYLYLESYHEKQKFLEYLEYYEHDISAISPELMHKCLDKANRSASVFSIQLLQEYLGIDERLLNKISKWTYRVNTPGKVSRKNWSVLLPVPLEELQELGINKVISQQLKDTKR